MVTLPQRGGKNSTYCLTDGTPVAADQFAQIKDFLRPADSGLFDGAEPQCWEWAK